MKRVRKSFLLALFLVLMPFVVSARSLEDLELKWTDEIEDDGYIFNPITELDPDYAKYYHGYNESKFIETDDGYLVIGNSSFSLFDRKKGLVNSIDFVEWVKDGDNYIAIDYDSEHETYSINVFNKRLDLIDESEIFDYYVYIIDFFLEDDSLVVVYEIEDDDSGGCYLNSLILDKETLKEKHSSKLLTGNYTYFYSNKIYYDSYNNYYYLDDDFNIVPNNLNDDGSYFVSGNSFLVLLDKDGKILNSVNVEKTDGYSYSCTFARKYNNIYYFFRNEYKYDSASDKYLQRVVYYKYDNYFKLVATKTLTGNPTDSYSSYYAGLYVNKEGIFTYYSYNNQYYKIEDDFSFTTSNNSYMYDEIEKSVVSQKEPEYNIQLKAYSFSDYYLDKLASKREEKLAKDLDENYSAYVYYSYDTYYDENNEQFIIAVTWLDNIYNSGNYEYYIESELIYVDEENLELPTRVTLVKREQYKGRKLLFFSYNIGAKMYVDDENIIVALGLGNRIVTNIYDRDGKLIKNLSEKKEKNFSPQMVSYSNGKLFVIFSVEEYDSGISSTNSTGNNFSDVRLNDSSSLPGLDDRAAYSYVEYYETPFIITTKTDGNGTIESTKIKASSGEEIKFTITPKSGYVLKNVKVTDSNGNVVVFADYTFTMPSNDVIIEASFVPENPNTTDIAIIGIITTSIIASIYVYKKYKKIKWMNS